MDDLDRIVSFVLPLKMKSKMRIFSALKLGRSRGLSTYLRQLNDDELTRLIQKYPHQFDRATRPLYGLISEIDRLAVLNKVLKKKAANFDHGFRSMTPEELLSEVTRRNLKSYNQVIKNFDPLYHSIQASPAALKLVDDYLISLGNPKTASKIKKRQVRMAKLDDDQRASFSASPREVVERVRELNKNRRKIEFEFGRTLEPKSRPMIYKKPRITSKDAIFVLHAFLGHFQKYAHEMSSYQALKKDQIKSIITIFEITQGDLREMPGFYKFLWEKRLHNEY